MSDEDYEPVFVISIKNPVRDQRSYLRKLIFDEGVSGTELQGRIKVVDVKSKEEPTMANRLMQFFKYDHLPPHLQECSRQFHTLATELEKFLPENAEKTVALRKLLEAKDCAVRALLFKES